MKICCFSVLYHCKMNISGFQAIGLTKQAIWLHQFGLWGCVMGNNLLFANILWTNQITDRSLLLECLTHSLFSCFFPQDLVNKVFATRTVFPFFHFFISRITVSGLFYCFSGKSYLQHMTALQERARSRKYCRTPNVRAYLRVFPSIMSAKSFSL